MPKFTEPKLLSQLELNESDDSKQTRDFYDSWAETYEQDVVGKLHFSSPHKLVDYLAENFDGSREKAAVLDVACGTGLVAKLMVDLGFKNFVGVDSSGGMLKQAAQTGLYQALHQNLLGTEALSAEPDTYDIVALAGALDVGFVPISVVRELCSAAKSGGYICISRGHHKGEQHVRFKQELEAELKSMEQEGLWSHMGTKHNPHYMEKKKVDSDEKEFIDGVVYLYRKN
ncbi:methyltransferase-like protein 27 [Neosynchiropus ocellatus]